MSNDASSVLIEGPWEHRFVSANGARFHVAELGDGPLVVLLHGFPQFWWAWRGQLTAIAEAKPSTLEELAALAGVGPSKLARYGEDVLRVLVESTPL